MARSQRMESLLHQATISTANEYFQKTSLNGFGLLYYIRRRKYQRFFWFLFIALGICCAAYIVLYTLYASLGDPTITSPHAPYALISDLSFPAVMLCSMNKLSRAAVLQYADELSQRYAQQNANDWLPRLRLLSAFYVNNVNTTEAAQLDIDLQLNISVVSLLEKLTPTCENQILECHWAGQQHDCKDLFAPLFTPIGHCCAFNYRPQHVRQPAGTLPTLGLKLRLNTSVADYFYTTSSTGGAFTIQLFDPGNFPDVDTGYLQQFSVMAGEDLDIQLFASTQLADADAHAVGKQRRRCYFSDENPHDTIEEGEIYSHANCLMYCKAKSMLEQCGCVPHYVPADTSGAVTCSLRHMNCIQQHHADWHRRVSTTSQSSIASNCGHCMPLCSYQRYEYRKQNIWPPTLSLNESVVQLYFPTPEARNTYRKDVIYTWYQVLSNIGGVLGICMGCSFISGFEIVFFLIYRLPVQLLKLKGNMN